MESWPRFRFSFRVPLHSSYVKGDQRFAAIHQHKLPDLQGQVNNRVTFDDIQNVEDLRSSATFMTLFFLYMFYSTCSFWLIAQHNQQHPFACLIQPKALPSCHLQKHKKKPPLITWSTSLEAISLLFQVLVSVSPGNHLFLNTSPACNKDSVAANTAGSNSLRTPSCIGWIRRDEKQNCLCIQSLHALVIISCFLIDLDLDDW